MRTRLMTTMVLMALVLTCLLMACEVDDYETGDGEYSFMRADFANVHTGEAKVLTSAVTDEGDSLIFGERMQCSWATTPDSVYRALVYYSRERDSKGLDVHGISAQQVLVLRIPSRRPAVMLADPLSMESAWLSAGSRYLNLGLYVKTGVKEGMVDVKQTLGVVCDTVMPLDNGANEHRLRLFHNQNGVPEYYSSRVYASIPTGDIPAGDVVRLEVATYDGTVVRYFNY